MLKQMPKLVLLVALVATFLVSSAPAYDKSCNCFTKHGHRGNGCAVNTNAGNFCVNTGCPGICLGT